MRADDRAARVGPMSAFARMLVLPALLMLGEGVRAAECFAPADIIAASAPPAPQATHLRAYRLDFSSPVRLAIGNDGSVYIADAQKGEVVVRAADGRILQHRRDLGRPGAIAVDGAHNVYLADLDSGAVSVFDSSWQRINRFADGNVILQPGDMAIDEGASRIYVTDTEAHTVRVFSTAGEPLFEFGDRGEGDGQFLYPSGVHFDALAGEVLVADQLGFRVQVFDLDGAYKYCIGGNSASSGSFFQRGRLLSAPQGLWADRLGRIYVADSFEGQVKVIDRAGRKLAGIASFGHQAGALRQPADLVMDGASRLFVASANNARVEMFGIDNFDDPEQYAPALLAVPDTQITPAEDGPFNLSFRVPGYHLSAIDTDSIRINGLVPTSIATTDSDADAIPELSVTLDRTALLGTLPPAGSGAILLQGALPQLAFTATATVDVIADTEGDSDGDGIIDRDDACADTAFGEVVDGSGCALNQYCACGDFARHGHYVKCVRKQSRVFLGAGLLGKKQRGQLIRAAARSDCATRPHHQHDGDEQDEDADDAGDDLVQHDQHRHHKAGHAKSNRRHDDQRRRDRR